MSTHAAKNKAASPKPARSAKHGEPGLRRVRVLAPDTAAPGFAEMARAQSRRVAMAETGTDDMDFIEAVQADNPVES